jgi:signal peptidase II
LGFNYVRNLGAAWGALSNLPDNVRVPFFYVVTIVAVFIIGLYIKTTPVEHRLTIFALGLILSGAVGNFIDRLRVGYVIDWIDVRWNLMGWRYDFPNFNVADSAITVGVLFLLFDMLVLESLRRRSDKTNTAPGAIKA